MLADVLKNNTEHIVFGQVHLVRCLTAWWSLLCHRFQSIILAVAPAIGGRECAIAGAGLEMAQHAVEEAQQAADTAHIADAHKATQAAQAQSLSRCPALLIVRSFLMIRSIQHNCSRISLHVLPTAALMRNLRPCSIKQK